MTTFQWDRSLLIPSKAGPPKYVPNNSSGGTGLGGSEQIVGNTPGRWSMKFSNITLNSPEKILKWNEISARCEGRLNPILIPIFDRQRAPANANAIASVAAAPGAATMTIQLSGVLHPGHHFSVAERLYRISQINSVTHSGLVATYNVTIRPPVREAIAVNTLLEFSDPWFRVRLASDDEMDAELDLLKYDQPSVSFMEDA